MQGCPYTIDRQFIYALFGFVFGKTDEKRSGYGQQCRNGVSLYDFHFVIQ